MKADEKVNLTTGQKVKLVRTMEGLTQDEFAARIPSRKQGKETTAQKISNLENDRCVLTRDMAQKIVDAFPESGYRMAWLEGYDDYMTEREYEDAERERTADRLLTFANSIEAKERAAMMLLELHGVQFLKQDLPQDVDFVLGAPVATYNGITLSNTDISEISDKLFDLLSLELKYIVRERQRVSNRHEENSDK